MVDLKCKKRSLEFLSFLAQDSHIITPTPPEILNLLQKSNMLVLLRKRWMLLQYPAAQGALLRDFIRFCMHRDGFNLMRPDLNKGCFNRRTCTWACWIKKIHFAKQDWIKLCGQTTFEVTNEACKRPILSFPFIHKFNTLVGLESQNELHSAKCLLIDGAQ